MKCRRFISFVVAMSICLSASYLTIHAENEDQNNINNVSKLIKTKYLSYLTEHKSYDKNPSEITLHTNQANTNDVKKESNYLGSKNEVVLMKDTDSITWEVDIPKDSIYTVSITYIPIKGYNGTIEQKLLLDGKVPYKEGSYFSLKRKYKDLNDKDRLDLLGNDLKPNTEELFEWSTASLVDPSGYITTPLQYALSAGKHTITLQGQSSSVAVEKITLQQSEENVSYQEYKSANKGLAQLTEPVYVEGEDLYSKSDVTIYPITDRVSPATSPQDPQYVKLNTIGGAKWKTAGQSITWQISVPQSGYYKIAPRFKQSLVDGTYVSRKLYINGEVPFAEAENIKFKYNSNWKLQPLGDEDQEYEFFLNQGTNTITLEVTLGDAGEHLGVIEDSLNNLNAIYRSILMITGSVPDTQRDYHFEKLIPNEIKQLEEEYQRISDVVNKITAESGRGSYVSLLNKILFQIEKMYKNPRNIAKNLEEFKSNIGSLGTWLLTAREQPLEIDQIYVLGDNNKLPKADSSVLGKFWFGIKCFVYSFFNDYTSIGQSVESQSDKEITVWIQTGRDQATIMRQLIDHHFTEKFNIRVNLQLVAPGTLLPSVLAKKGPDVALNNGGGDPINYAIRNANVELSQLDGFDEVIKRFNPNSLAPYTFNGKTYALPETLSFPMFFYRVDIFEELGLKPPKTWDELIALIPVLQRRNMTMAFPGGIAGYSIMLFQNGGEFYVNDGEKSNLNSDISLETFQEFTELFTLYRLPVTYDFPNRFRTGEMPCGIQDYSIYNQLAVFAPEIKGLWEFIPLPGKVDANGNINNVSVAGGSNVMIMSGCKDIDSSWEFLKWWTDEEAQGLFAVEMESTLGPAAKQPTANINALLRMPWSSEEAKNITDQLNNVKAIPEVPGGYFTTRVLDFAFRNVYNNRENPIEVIGNYIDELNEELTRKRAEFGLK